MFFIVFLPFFNKFWAKIKESTELIHDKTDKQKQANPLWSCCPYETLFFPKKPDKKSQKQAHYCNYTHEKHCYL